MLKAARVIGARGGGPGMFRAPADATALPEGAVCVVDRNNHRLQVYSRAHNLSCILGERGTGPGQFYYPRGVACGGDALYVSDASVGHHRVQKLRLDGEPVGSVGTFGEGDGEFSMPGGLCVVDDTLYVCEHAGRGIQRASGIWRPQELSPRRAAVFRLRPDSGGVPP